MYMQYKRVAKSDILKIKAADMTIAMKGVTTANSRHWE